MLRSLRKFLFGGLVLSKIASQEIALAVVDDAMFHYGTGDQQS